jgi:hypothetical protein
MPNGGSPLAGHEEALRERNDRIAELEKEVAALRDDKNDLDWLGAMVEDEDTWRMVTAFIEGFMNPYDRGCQTPEPGEEEDDDEWNPTWIRSAIQAAREEVEKR